MILQVLLNRARDDGNKNSSTSVVLLLLSKLLNCNSYADDTNVSILQVLSDGICINGDNDDNDYTGTPTNIVNNFNNRCISFLVWKRINRNKNNVTDVSTRLFEEWVCILLLKLSKHKLDEKSIEYISLNDNNDNDNEEEQFIVFVSLINGECVIVILSKLPKRNSSVVILSKLPKRNSSDDKTKRSGRTGESKEAKHIVWILYRDYYLLCDTFFIDTSVLILLSKLLLNRNNNNDNGVVIDNTSVLPLLLKRIRKRRKAALNRISIINIHEDSIDDSDSVTILQGLLNCILKEEKFVLIRLLNSSSSNQLQKLDNNDNVLQYVLATRS